MKNGVQGLLARAARSAHFRLLAGTALALGVVACSDDGGGTTGDGTGGGPSGSGGAGPSGQGGGIAGSGGAVGSGGAGGGTQEPQFEGTFWVESHLHVGGSLESAAYGLFWEVGAGQQTAIEEWYDQVLGSAAPLAVGECALITQGGAPTYTALTVGPSVYVRNGSTDLIETLGPPQDPEYFGDGTETVANALHAGAFTLAIDPGEGQIPPLTSSSLGPLVDVVVPANASCSVATDCALTAAPSEPVDEMLFMFDLTYVCRGNPTTGAFTLTTDVLASDGDNVANVQVYAVKRQAAAMGPSTVNVQLVTRTEFLVDLL